MKKHNLKEDIIKYIGEDVDADVIYTALRDKHYTVIEQKEENKEVVGIPIPCEIVKEEYKQAQISMLMLFEIVTHEHEDPGYDPYWAGYVSYTYKYNYMGITGLGLDIELEREEKKKELIELVKENQNKNRRIKDKEKAVVPYRMTAKEKHIEKAILGSVLWSEVVYDSGFSIDNVLKIVLSQDNFDYETRVFFDVIEGYTAENKKQKITVYANVTDLKKIIRNPEYVVDLINNEGEEDVNKIKFVLTN